VNGGASQTFTITPNSGYQVNAVTVDGASQGAVTTYTFANVTANHTISATFKTATVQYTITASAAAGGTISPSGSVLVNGGASQTFTITPNSGYQIGAVTVDGSNRGAVTTFTFTSVTANHTISATFSGSYGNLAAGKTATASSEISGGTYGAAKMNDDNATTRWAASATTFPQWAKIDLGAQYSISEVEMMFAFAGAAGDCYDFTIETSSDNVNWTTRVNQNPNTNTAQTQRYGFTTTSARYVRITITGAPGAYRASLYEFRVFGQ
jgi:hypothetical protein